MKTSLIKIYIVVFILISDFRMFAQFPSDDDDGDLQGDDAPPVTIAAKIFLLAIAGIFFAFYVIRKKESINSKKDSSILTINQVQPNK